jgi:FtsP/CotA-like multicopper oxidase with cupredoxin domain
MTSNEDESDISRRRFLDRVVIASGAVLSGVIAGTAYSAIDNPDRPSALFTGAAGADSTMAGMGSSTAAPTMTPEEMDAAHKAGVDAFLANQKNPITKGKGNLPLDFKLVDGVKVFELGVGELDWETTPGNLAQARAYNSMLPGPVIRATEGDRVRINVKNNLKESTAVHWHGVLVPNSLDGVHYITQQPIKAGQTFSYEFTLRNSGTHMYHSHHNSMDQVNRGLLGAFIIDPKDKTTYPHYDREYIMVLNDLNLGFTINGKGFPATEALSARLGETILIRWINEGLMSHPMHLHGMPMKVIAKDGYPMATPQLCDTLDVAPGNRYDVLVEATEPGAWAFHCHILSHAESEAGMFGLVTALIVS